MATLQLSKYHRQGYTVPSFRMLASLLDALILVAVNIGLAIAGFNIMKAVPSYKEQLDKVDEYRIACYKIEEESGLMVFDKEDPTYYTFLSEDELFDRYLLSHVLLSYNLEPTSFHYVPEDSLKVGQASLINDLFAKYFVTYVDQYNTYKGKTNDLYDRGSYSSMEFFNKKITSYVMENGEYPWNTRDIDNNYKHLTASYAEKLYSYRFKEEKVSDYLTQYNLFRTSFHNLWNDSVSVLTSSSRYGESYALYKDAYTGSAYGVDLMFVLVYLISFSLVFLLPEFIFKNGRTIGLLATRSATISYDTYDMKKSQFAIKNIIMFFSFFCTLVISCYFAGGYNSGFMYPLFMVGSVGISLFHIAAFFFLIALINMFMVVAREHHQNIQDSASHTIVVSTKDYQEIKDLTTPVIIDEQTKAATDVMEPLIPGMVEDKPYFDSSSFNNKEREASYHKGESKK